MHHISRLLSFDTTVEVLDTTHGALRGRVYRREIPFVRVGRRVFFDRDQLEAWIAKNSVPAREQAAVSAA